MRLKQNRGGRAHNEAYRYYRRAQAEGKPLWSYYFPYLKHNMTQNTVGDAVMGAAIQEEDRLYEKREAERKESEPVKPILWASGMPIVKA